VAGHAIPPVLTGRVEMAKFKAKAKRMAWISTGGRMAALIRNFNLHNETTILHFVVIKDLSRLPSCGGVPT